MARDVISRLSRLESRRKGFDRLSRLALDEQIEIMAKRDVSETWQSRASRSQAYTRYTLGSMQEVGEAYTKKSIETAERVGNQLRSGLNAVGLSVEFRLQGSVPLNVHIRGVSDVDLLNLDANFLTYTRTGPMSYSAAPSGKTSKSVLTALRRESEKVLKARFPAAIVETSGSKAINVSGGSLPRAVDVVPSHWHDSLEYQHSRQEHDRTVTLLNQSTMETLDNLPFRHIKLVDERDRLMAAGGLKKAIRLCKNVKADALEERKEIPLPSFDIAAIMYHANMSALAMGQFYELAILGETQRFLDFLYGNRAYAATLMVPDGTRHIFDAEEKFNGLTALSMEIDDLAREVAKEHSEQLQRENTPSLEQSRNAISKLVI